MNQTLTKRRSILLASIIVVVIVISLIGTLIIFYCQLSPTKLYVNMSLNQTNVIQGNNLQALVNVTSIGKAENVTLSSNSGSSGINCTLEPSMGKSNFTSTLTMSVSDSTPTGNYSITITASDKGGAVNASSVISVLSADVTVSGSVNIVVLPGFEVSSLAGIQFTDVQTGNVTTFRFTFAPQSSNPVGNYSVTLKNGHTYSVTISYYYGAIIGGMQPASDYIETFTVNAPAGQTAITENFTR